MRAVAHSNIVLHREMLWSSLQTLPPTLLSAAVTRSVTSLVTKRLHEFPCPFCWLFNRVFPYVSHPCLVFKLLHGGGGAGRDVFQEPFLQSPVAGTLVLGTARSVRGQGGSGHTAPLPYPGYRKTRACSACARCLPHAVLLL